MAAMFTKIRSKFYYWHFFVALIILRYILLSIANYSQWSYLVQTTVPTDVKAYLDQATWEGVRAEGLKHFKFVFWQDFTTQAYLLIMLGFGLLPKAWHAFTKFSNSHLSSVIDEKDDFTRSILFSGLYTMFVCLLIVPLINIWTYDISDLRVLPSDLISILFGIGFQWVFLLIVRLCCKRKIIVTSVILVLIGIFYAFITVYACDILTNGLKRFSQDPENSNIWALLRKTGFPLHRVFEQDILNAYTAGIGKRAVIVVGTKLQEVGMTKSMIEGIVGHELGHWTYYHLLLLPISLTLSALVSVISFFYIVDRPSFYKSLGFHDFNKVPMGIGALLFSLLAFQMTAIMKPLWNLFSWQLEFQADSFSARLGYAKDLIGGFIVFAKQYNIVHMPFMTTFYGMFHADHPVFIDRVNALAKYIK